MLVLFKHASIELFEDFYADCKPDGGIAARIDSQSRMRYFMDIANALTNIV